MTTHASYKSVDECFEQWQEGGFTVPQQLMEMSSRKLVNFVQKFYVERVRSLDYVWKDCFEHRKSVREHGNMVEGYKSTKDKKKVTIEKLYTLTKKDLVYLILNMENHSLFAAPSIWSIVQPKEELDEKLKAALSRAEAEVVEEGVCFHWNTPENMITLITSPENGFSVFITNKHTMGTRSYVCDNEHIAFLKFEKLI